MFHFHVAEISSLQYCMCFKGRNHMKAKSRIYIYIYIHILKSISSTFNVRGRTEPSAISRNRGNQFVIKTFFSSSTLYYFQNGKLLDEELDLTPSLIWNAVRVGKVKFQYLIIFLSFPYLLHLVVTCRKQITT